MQLKRNTQDKLLCGVLSGIAQYLGVSSLIVRIAYIILAFIHPVFIFIYIALALILPAEKPDSATSAFAHAQQAEDWQTQQTTQSTFAEQKNAWKNALAGSNVFFASLCIVLGVFSLLFRNSELFSFASVGALIVLVTGFYLFSQNMILLSSFDADDTPGYAKRRMNVGIVLMILGVVWILYVAGVRVLTMHAVFVAFRALWPVLLIAMGLSFLLRQRKARRVVWACVGVVFLAYTVLSSLGVLAKWF